MRITQQQARRGRGQGQGYPGVHRALQDPQPEEEDPHHLLHVVLHLHGLLRTHAQQQQPGLPLHQLLCGEGCVSRFQLQGISDSMTLLGIGKNVKVFVILSDISCA